MKELEYTTQSVPKDRRFCTICGQVKRLHYFEGDSTHCSACCEKMLHTRLHGWCFPLVLSLLLVAAAAVILSVQTVPYCLSLFRAEEAVRDKRLADACSLYAEAVSGATERNAALLSGGKKEADGTYPVASKTLFEAGTRTWTHYLEIYAALYSEYEAANLAAGSLNARTAASVPTIAGLNEAKQAYDDTLAFAQEVDAKYPYDSAEDLQYDDIMTELSSYADESESRYIKGYVEFYKGRLTQFYMPDDPDASRAYFEKMLEYLPDEFMNVYTAEAEAAMTAKDYGAAIAAYEAILAKNANYTDAYAMIAEAAFLSGNTEKRVSALAHYDEDDPLRLQLEMRYALRSDDLEAAAGVRQRANATIVPQAQKIFGSLLSEQTITQSDKTTLLSYVNYALYDAAYALVLGDAQDAFDIAYSEAFNDLYYYTYITNDSGAITQSALNMAMLCASLMDEKEAISTITQVGQCDETTQQMIDGKLTARDVFVEGKAEII